MREDFSRFRHAQRGARNGRLRAGSKRRSGFSSQLVIATVMMFALVWNYGPQLGAAATAVSSTAEENRAREQSRYFSGCNEARAAGVAPIYRGQPGYREQMDGDSDGIACEPYRGR